MRLDKLMPSISIMLETVATETCSDKIGRTCEHEGFNGLGKIWNHGREIVEEELRAMTEDSGKRNQGEEGLGGGWGSGPADRGGRGVEGGRKNVGNL